MKAPLPPEEEPAFQMAPMIDMVFLLLVFFMCASHLSQRRNLELDIPTASKAVIPRERPDRWTVNVTRDGTVYSAMTETTIEELSARVRAELKRVPDLKIYLRADARTPHREVKAVMNAMAAAGIDNFIFGVYIPPENRPAAGGTRP